MPKFEKKEVRPTVEAIRTQWGSATSVYIPHGDWIIKHSDGHTTHCSDDYFQQNYRQVED